MKHLAHFAHGLIASTAIVAVLMVPPTHTFADADRDWPAEAQAIVDEQVAAITAGNDCTGADQPRLVDRVLVRNARLRDGNTAVVRVVTSDQAFAAAKAGDVVVLGYCA